jgi:hypothetical protein
MQIEADDRVRRVRLLATTDNLTAIGYENALAQIRAEIKQ